MLTQLIFIASLLLASFTGSFGQSQGGTTPETNGGVSQFRNPGFTQIDPTGATIPNWQTTGTPGPQIDSTRFAITAPNSVRFNSDTTVSLSQMLDVHELGEVLTFTFYMFTDGQNTPLDFAVSFSFNNQPLTVLRTRGTSGPNGFVKQTVLIQAPSTGSRMGRLAIIFNADNSGNTYYIDDVSITGSLIIGDPQFIGLRGQSYQVHGVDGEVYNLVSSTNTQVNSRFAFLTGGDCPVFNGVPAKNCWSHPGSYLGAIGVQQVVDGKVQQLSIVSGSAKQGFASVTLNGQTFAIGSKVDGELFSVNFISSHSIKVKTEEFSFTFDNSDMFINQQVSARVPLSALTSHGLFGQTHESKVYSTAIKYIVGEVDDYVIADGELFGKDFVYNQFQM